MKKADGSITILGKPYSVYYTNETMSGGSIMGATNRDKQTIVINTEYGPEQNADTMIHEIVHIIDAELKIGLSEEDVARMAVGLYSAGIRPPVVKKK